ncbi:MAG TPA: DUF465 domain-containing protein [Sphingomicrobium sp.]|jgi:uncharacterized protein YdcH (DUF465 family)
MNPRLYRLLEVHQRLDEQLISEERRRLPNWRKVMQLKRLKLRAKDLIHRLTLRPERI